MKQQVKKTQNEKGNSDIPRFAFNLYLGLKCFFFHKYISLNLCQIGEHLHNTFLTKLLSQFIGLH